MPRISFKISAFCCSILLIYLRVFRNHISESPFTRTSGLSNDIESDLSFISENTSSIPENSLTAILPVTITSLPSLRRILQPIVHPPTASIRLHEILLVAQDHVIPNLRAELFTVMSQIEFSRHVHCSIRSWQSTSSESEALMQAATTSSTEWLLVLDKHGLEKLDQETRTTLLSPPVTPLLLGPRGFRLSLNASCLQPSQSYQKASYLIPPFVMPKSLTARPSHLATSWAAFGTYLSNFMIKDTRAGGLVLPQSPETKPEMSWCNLSDHSFSDVLPLALDSESLFESWTNDFSVDLPSGSLLPDETPILLGITFSTINDLESFAPVACSLEKRGYTLQIALCEPSPISPKIGHLEHSLCTLYYQILSAGESPAQWVAKMEEQPTVMITLSEMAELFDGCSSASMICIPRVDLEHSTWMSSLTSREWRDWNIPQITISIITKDRPQSLSRLLSSISNARFFGDKVDLRINLEQSSSLETMNIVSDFHWNHGSIWVHHRVIHGGLLTAVAESWFPHSNDSFGVLLEDDVEVSPLFYAWIKMALLRYRYGSNRGMSPQMFGISLYQPKNLELDVVGRRPFDVSPILHSIGAPASSPYLSQVPCSWGALYFPEHWKEFHDYLAMRFTESAFNLTQIVVPNVRSNQWTRSWKKYFIELVYLRGYVMLYPNFPEYVSLSTNHLEVGSHVKIRSKEKMESFSVPLMKLRDRVDLLDLPDRSLPRWISLPVLNLTGFPTTLDRLFKIGISRHLQLGLCEKRVGWLGESDPFCLNGTLDGL
ncbi:hypothetical protein GYMLUDRAFT_225825 [Collybiopsis luxurians FD-317 M1]|uniref:Uncharacterized protein n=1 Tax=Collybiopsis luxurians FD-317 M1 TaxID=944289 RepID=A0A0D0B9I0_9AGAR|nr:hypothetical protein GYMLUDRAFT_225825 [Collybiopsis luxurians FD-317 M1]